MPKRTTKTLSLGDKLKLLEEVASGESKKKDIARRHGIPCSTLSTIWVQRERYMGLARAGAQPASKRTKGRKFPRLESELWEWVREQAPPLTGSRIRKRAQLVARRTASAGFKASEGWLEGFQQRYRFKTEKGKLVTVPGPTPLPDPAETGEEFILLFNNPEDTDPQTAGTDAAPVSFPVLEIKQEPDWLKEYDQDPNPEPKDPKTPEVPPTAYRKLNPVVAVPTSIQRKSSVARPELRPSRVFVPPADDRLTDYHLQCFGSYIVSELKQMDPRTCVMVQRTISDIIFDAKIKKFGN